MGLKKTDKNIVAYGYNMGDNTVLHLQHEAN